MQQKIVVGIEYAESQRGKIINGNAKSKLGQNKSDKEVDSNKYYIA